MKDNRNMQMPYIPIVEENEDDRSVMDGFYHTLLSISAEEDEIAKTEKEEVFSVGGAKLYRYKSPLAKDEIHKVPVLIVYSLINRLDMMDLQPSRSMIAEFLAGGLDVYIIDWGYPTQKDMYLTEEDYIDRMLDCFVDKIRLVNGVESINLLGVCIGGIMSAIYASMNQSKIRNMVVLVTPVNFEADDATFYQWYKETDYETFFNAQGLMNGEILNYSFLLLKPILLNVDKYRQIYKMPASQMATFLKMDHWSFDCPDVSGSFLKNCLFKLFARNSLVKGTFKLGNKPINLKNVTCPVLNVCGKKDHIVTVKTNENLLDLLGSTDKESVLVDAGHIGLFVSSKAVKVVGAKIVSWLRER